MLVLRRCPRGAFPGILVSVKTMGYTTFLTIKVPYVECTKNVLGDIHISTKKVLFCINSQNERTFMDELEYIISTTTNVPLENVYFSYWFVNEYVRKKRWKEYEERACLPTSEQIKEEIRQHWLYK